MADPQNVALSDEPLNTSVRKSNYIDTPTKREVIQMEPQWVSLAWVYGSGHDQERNCAVW
ncbi:MAG: hypothetical protein HUJ26_00355 [Planctomycetaceae bacterium]|nr:hypothetical protein [Planctomycetaceae bacterium]